MCEWMTRTPRNTAKVCCYGDDTRIVYRTRDGRLYCIDPDFTQMDGSVDQELVRQVIDVVKKSLFARWGDNSLWSKICDWWLWFAINPIFMVQGKRAWQKKREHGLMTGVPGTTLFDTCKSIISWESLIHKLNGNNELEKLLDKKFVAEYMLRECGLEIKEGTYEPEICKETVDEIASNNGFLCSHKFLGVQIQKRTYKGQDVYIPYVPEDEILAQILSPKDNPLIMKRMSIWAKQRLEFDRCRGVYITSAFAHDRATSLLHNIVNSLPGGPILMATQFEKGQPPETILLPEFQFPNSSGFPNYDFVMKLYGEFEEEGEFPPLFTNLTRDVSEAIGSLRLAKLSLKPPDAHGVRDVCVKEAEPRSYDLPGLLDSNKDHPVKKPNLPVPNKYTTTVRVEDGKPGKPEIFPNLEQSLCRLAAEVEACDEVLELKDIERRLGLSPDLVKRALRKSKLYCADGLVSTKPIIAQAQQVVKDVRKENEAQKAPVVVKTKMQARIDRKFIEALKPGIFIPPKVTDELGILNHVAAKSGFRLKYLTATVDVRKEKPVNVILLYAPVGTDQPFRQQAASTHGRRALDGKVAIAKEILATCGYSSAIPSLPNQTRRIEPRVTDDWADESEFASEAIRFQPTELTIDSQPMQLSPAVELALNAQARQAFKALDRRKRQEIERALENLYPNPLRNEQIKNDDDVQARDSERNASEQAEKSNQTDEAVGNKNGESGNRKPLSPTQRRNARRRRAQKSAKDSQKQNAEGAKEKPADGPSAMGPARNSSPPVKKRNLGKSSRSPGIENRSPARSNRVGSKLGVARPPPVWRGD